MNTEMKELSDNIKKQIDEWVTRYPAEQKRSGVLQALRFVQDDNDDWLSEELMDAVADYLDMPKMAVYEVATFYGMYNLKPVGKNTVAICNNISCMLCGSENLIEHLENRLGIKVGETTKDGAITLKEVECLAGCAFAPVMQVNDKKYHENMTVEKIDKLLDEIAKGKGDV